MKPETDSGTAAITNKSNPRFLLNLYLLVALRLLRPYWGASDGALCSLSLQAQRRLFDKGGGGGISSQRA